MKINYIEINNILELNIEYPYVKKFLVDLTNG